MGGRRAQRVAVTAVVALGAVLLLAGVAYLVLSRGGTSTPVAGTPYTVERAPGVGGDDLDLVRRGLLVADRTVREELGAEVDAPVRVRVTDLLGCSFLDSTTGVADANSLCLYVGGDAWHAMVGLDPTVVLGTVVHEDVHVLQGQLGCLPDGDDREYAWWTEGTATYYSWQGLIGAGLVDDEQAQAWQEQFADTDEDLLPLSSYETTMGGDKAYHLAAGAAAELDRIAGPEGFVDFCTHAASGWLDAFVRAYGIDVEEFYDRFEGLS